MDSAEVQYEHYFSRQIKLWGVEKQRSLQDKKVAIIGCGGLGSSLSLSLGTSGIGTIHLIDFDTVSLHNIHRQLAFTLEDIGRSKAGTIVRLLLSKNPYVRVMPFEMDFASFAQMDNSYDLIIDATDNISARKQIDSWAKEKRIPWIYGSVEAFMGHVCFFEKASFGVFGSKEHELDGVAATMVMHIASFQANLALRYLVGLPVVKDELYYVFFDKKVRSSLKDSKCLHIPNPEIETHDYALSSHPRPSFKTIAEPTGATQVFHKPYEYEHSTDSKSPISGFVHIDYLPN